MTCIGEGRTREEAIAKAKAALAKLLQARTILIQAKQVIAAGDRRQKTGNSHQALPTYLPNLASVDHKLIDQEPKPR